MCKSITCKNIFLAFCLTCALAFTGVAKDYKFTKGISYRPDAEDDYQKQMCKVDVAWIEGNQNSPVVVWFHGGGLTGGSRELPSQLQRDNIVVVGVEYRLSPKVDVDTIIDDSAAAVAWTFDHIAEYGGSSTKIYIAGHSAGGYLVNMVGLDMNRLKKYGKDANQLAGIIPFSGHAITHFNTREKMGMPAYQALIDSTAPLFYVRKDAPPILILSGDREKELYGRYEETAFFWRMLKLAGHPDVTLYEFDGYDHGNMRDPGFPLAIQFIREHEKKRK